MGDCCQCPTEDRFSRVRQPSMHSEVNSFVAKQGIVAERIRSFQKPRDNDNQELTRSLNRTPLRQPSRLARERIAFLNAGDEDSQSTELLRPRPSSVPPIRVCEVDFTLSIDPHSIQPQKESLNFTSSLANSEGTGSGTSLATVTGALASVEEAEQLAKKHIPTSNPPVHEPSKSESFGGEPNRFSESFAQVRRTPPSPGTYGHVKEARSTQTPPQRPANTELSRDKDVPSDSLSPRSRSHLRHHQIHHPIEGLHTPEAWCGKEHASWQSSDTSHSNSFHRHPRPKRNIAREIAAMIDTAMEGRSDTRGSASASPALKQPARPKPSKEVVQPHTPVQRIQFASVSPDRQLETPTKSRAAVAGPSFSEPPAFKKRPSYDQQASYTAPRKHDHYELSASPVGEPQFICNNCCDSVTKQPGSIERLNRNSFIQSDPRPIMLGKGLASTRGKRINRRLSTKAHEDVSNPAEDRCAETMHDGSHGRHECDQDGTRKLPKAPTVTQSILAQHRNLAEPTPHELPTDHITQETIPMRSPAVYSHNQTGHSRRLRWWKLVLSEKMPSNTEIELREERERRAQLHAKATASQSLNRYAVCNEESHPGGKPASPEICNCHSRPRMQRAKSSQEQSCDPFVGEDGNGAYVELHGAFDGAMDMLENALGNLGRVNQSEKSASDSIDFTKQIITESDRSGAGWQNVVRRGRTASGEAYMEKNGGMKVIINIGEDSKETISIQL